MSNLYTFDLEKPPGNTRARVLANNITEAKERVTLLNPGFTPIAAYVLGPKGEKDTLFPEDTCDKCGTHLWETEEYDVNEDYPDAVVTACKKCPPKHEHIPKPTSKPRLPVFAVDFDGTCVTHSYPDVGEEIGAAPVLKKLAATGCRIILLTMRGSQPSRDGITSTLDDAVKWFEKHGIPLYGINHNPDQHLWTTSPKVHANFYIDDAALGVPLIASKTAGARPHVDWVRMEQMIFNILA